MSEYQIPEMDGLYLRNLRDRDDDPAKSYLRLDLDRGTGAIYIYFYLSKNASVEISTRVQRAIDDFVPQLDEINRRCDECKDTEGTLGLGELVKAPFGMSKYYNVRRALKAKCEDLDEVAARHSGSGLQIELNYQLEVRQSKDAPY